MSINTYIIDDLLGHQHGFHRRGGGAVDVVGHCVLDRVRH